MTFQEIRRAFASGQQFNSCKSSGFSPSPENAFWMGVDGADIDILDCIQATDIGNISLD